MPNYIKLFWQKVTKTDNCWLWNGSVNKGGYGVAGNGIRGSSIGAHKLCYELLVGKVLRGMQLDHLCKNKLCVNPNHLEVVTPRANLLRSGNFVGINARKTHCKNGHSLSGLNLYITPSGFRNCKACRRQSSMRHYYA